MTCDECREQLILSEERGPVPAAAQEHLGQCHACQEFVQDGERLRKEVRLLAETEQAPRELREKIQAMFEDRAVSRKRQWLVWAGAAAALVLLVLGVYGWYYTRRSPTPDRLAREFITDYQSYLPGKAEIVSNSPRDIEQWFQGRVDFPVRVPALPAAAPVEARVCEIANRKAALVHYRRESDQALISFFVAVEPPAFEQARKSVRISASYEGVNAALWCHRGLVFSLVGAVDDASLNQMAQAVRQQSP